MVQRIPTWTIQYPAIGDDERTARLSDLLCFLFGQILILSANPHLTWAIAWCSSIWLPYPGHPRLADLNVALPTLNRALR